MSRIAIISAIAVSVPGGLLRAQGRIRPPSPAIRRPAAAAPAPAAASITSLSASPGTLTITANDPDTGTVTATATVSWILSGGSSANSWNLTVKANTSTFVNCGGSPNLNLPLSSVRVQCTSVSPSLNNTCSAPFTLPTAAAQVAGGKEASGTTPYQVRINYIFTDSWSYFAQVSSPCTMALTYTLTAL